MRTGGGTQLKVAEGSGRMAETPEALRKSGGCPLVAASVATLGHVRGRDPMDTSSAKQDEVDIGRDGADAVGGTEPGPGDSRRCRMR